jgi:hypothetical protein
MIEVPHESVISSRGIEFRTSLLLNPQPEIQSS